MRDIEISIQELRHGGYIVFEGAGDERRPLMAKTTLAETASAVRDLVEERRRSSMNKIVQRAWYYADHFEKMEQVA